MTTAPRRHIFCRKCLTFQRLDDGMSNMTKTETGTKTAPCGCTFQGRVYSLRSCTVIDTQTATGREQMRHAMAAEKKAK